MIKRVRCFFFIIIVGGVILTAYNFINQIQTAASVQRHRQEVRREITVLETKPKNRKCFVVYSHSPVPCNKTLPTWEDLERRFTMLQPGGYYKPSSCQPMYKINIIVPYRDREEHLKLFLQHMHPFLQGQKLEYTIFVVEQTPDDVFKKGLLMNAGFLESLNLSDTYCYVFHDVDMLPLDRRITYNCKSRAVKHVSTYIRQYDFRKPYGRYLGGVLIFHRDHFKFVNGFSNLYWGWGGEDDDMYFRLLHENISIELPQSMQYRFESWSHSRNEQNINRDKLVMRAAERMYEEGLNTAKYQVLQIEKKPLYTWIYISPKLTNGSYKDIHQEFMPNENKLIKN